MTRQDIIEDIINTHINDEKLEIIKEILSYTDRRNPYEGCYTNMAENQPEESAVYETQTDNFLKSYKEENKTLF